MPARYRDTSTKDTCASQMRIFAVATLWPPPKRAAATADPSRAYATQRMRRRAAASRLAGFDAMLASRMSVGG